MYVQDVALPSGSGRNKKNAEDYSRRTSTKSSDTNDRQNWSEGSASQTANISGKLRRVKCFMGSMLKTLFPNFLLYKFYLDSQFCLYLNLFFLYLFSFLSSIFLIIISSLLLHLYAFLIEIFYIC